MTSHRLDDKINEMRGNTVWGAPTICYAYSGMIALNSAQVDLALKHLEQTKVPLQEVNATTNNILPEMSRSYQKLTEKAASLPYITTSDIERITNQFSLDPNKNIDQEQLLSIQTNVTKQTTQVKSVMQSIEDTRTHIKSQDAQWARDFKINLLGY